MASYLTRGLVWPALRLNLKHNWPSLPDSPCIYLDFAKAYDSLLDWEHMLALLWDYSMGPKMLCIISHFGDWHTVVPYQQAVFREPFPA